MDSEPNLRDLARNACKGCRAKKVRCQQDSAEGIGGPCERCRRTGKVCEQSPPRPVRRAKAPKESLATPGDVANRIRRLEQSLEHVTAKLAHTQQPRGALPETGQGGLPSPAVETSQSPSGVEGSDTSSKRGQYIDVIDKGLLCAEYANVLVEEFRIMAEIFPYVVIPGRDVVNLLRRSFPMLFLSILTVASWRNRALQKSLEQEYLQRLGVLMVSEGEQTLELLQSLLVHLAWCHWHMKSAYRLHFFAASIVVSLGLNRRLIHGQNHKMMMRYEFKTPHFGRKAAESEPSDLSADAKRAYIGSYVISRSYSLIFRRFDTLKYNDALEEYALSLSRDPLTPSDATLIHHVRLIKYAEDVCETFGYTNIPPGPQLSTDTLPFIIQSLNTRLDSLRSAIPPSLSGNIALNYGHLSFRAYTYEISIYTLPATPDQPLTTSQTSLLLTTLQSVKSILDSTASISDLSIQTLPGFSWARLQYLFHLAIELTLCVDSPSWDITLVREMLPLERYIEDLCSRLDRNAAFITNAEKDSGKEGNWFQHIATNWRGIKNQYLNELSRKGILVHEPRITGEEIRQVGMMGEIMGDEMGMGSNTAFSTDFWAVDFIPPWYGAVPMGNGNILAPTF